MKWEIAALQTMIGATPVPLLPPAPSVSILVSPAEVMSEVPSLTARAAAGSFRYVHPILAQPAAAIKVEAVASRAVVASTEIATSAAATTSSSLRVGISLIEGFKALFSFASFQIFFVSQLRYFPSEEVAYLPGVSRGDMCEPVDHSVIITDHKNGLPMSFPANNKNEKIRDPAVNSSTDEMMCSSTGGHAHRTLPTWEDIRAEGPEIDRDDLCVSDDQLRRDFIRRRYFISKYGFAVPSKDAMRAVADFVEGGTLLEVGAGKGLWAALLQREGVKVVAVTDDFSSDGHQKIPVEYRALATYTDVEALSHLEAIAKYPTDVLLMVWPPLDKPMAAEALAAFEKQGGDKFVFIGEHRDDATADSTFWNRLRKNWQGVGVVRIPTWIGLGDSVDFFQRKKSVQGKTPKSKSSRRK